jgi:hypothetical protein
MITEIREALDDLTENCATSYDIAVKLANLGIKGNVGDDTTCPIANYITEKTGMSVQVGHWFVGPVYLYDIFEDILIKDFIYKFDQGVYQQLISVDTTGREEQQEDVECV